MREYKRGWKCDNRINGVLAVVDSIMSYPDLTQSKQIEEFKKFTKKSRSSFFRYKSFLLNGGDYKRVDVWKEEERRLKELVADSYKLKDGCSVWMGEFNKSRSSFFRMLRGIRAV